MAIQFSAAVRNARLDALEAAVGVSAKLEIFTGAMPANCATADSGTKLVSMTLPSDWMAAASGGAKALSGIWSATAIAGGTAGYFRIKDSTGTTVHEQGTITTVAAGTGDMLLDNTSILTGQTVAVTAHTLTDANA
jgi:hypothetical protein